MNRARRLLAALASGPVSPVVPFFRAVPWAIAHPPLRWLPARLTSPVSRAALAARGWWLLADWFIVTVAVVLAFRYWLLDAYDDAILLGMIGTLALTLFVQYSVNREWTTLGVGLQGLVVGYLVLYVPLAGVRFGWFTVPEEWSVGTLRAVVVTTGMMLVAAQVAVLWRGIKRGHTRRTHEHARYDRRGRGRGRRAADMTSGQFPAPSATKTDD